MMADVHLPPGSRAPAVVQTARFLRHPPRYFTALHKKHGDIFCARFIGFGRMVCTSTPELHREVFTTSPDVLRAGEANEILGPILGPNSVLLLDGDAHMRQRKLLLPPFHGTRMQTYVEIIREATSRAVDGWRAGDEVVLHKTMQDIALEVILRAVFGVDDARQLEALTDLIPSLTRAMSSPLALAAGFLPGLAHVLVRPARLRNDVDIHLYDEIQRRRKADDLAERDDILSLLLQATDEEGEAMTDVELRDELMSILVAGHETTATALAWAFREVLNQPDIEERARAEASEHGTDLDHLGYTDAIVKEVLRLRPVLTDVARRAAEPVEIGGYRLPAGIMVVPVIYLTHRQPSLYPDPERFDPERFIGKRPDPYEWIPFGGGVRRCIGAAFAMMQMKVVLATVLSRTRLRLVEEGPVSDVWHSITRAPADGTRVIVDEVM